jgi:methylmalonyl-CoA mutase cobalamin-binding subunit
MTDLSAEFKALAAYRPTHKVRFVTAASLFDGHDAAINIMRRILQGMGAEVIHLGHNRSVDEVVTAALQEDVQGIAISSYQGGHVEYFKYMVDLLRSAAARMCRSSAAAAASSCRPRSASCRATAWPASTAPRTASAWACRA